MKKRAQRAVRWLRATLFVALALSFSPIPQIVFAAIGADVASPCSPCTDDDTDACPPYCLTCTCAHGFRAPLQTGRPPTASVALPANAPTISEDIARPKEGPALDGIFHPPKA